jgi:hypothetical protein
MINDAKTRFSTETIPCELQAATFTVTLMYAMAGCMADTVGTVLVAPTADCDVDDISPCDALVVCFDAVHFMLALNLSLHCNISMIPTIFALGHHFEY